MIRIFTVHDGREQIKTSIELKQNQAKN